MIARSFWGVRVGKGAAEKRKDQAGDDQKPAVDNLLDARIEDDGQIAKPSKPDRRAKRAASDPLLSPVDELDLAVQKLSEGLEAIERQSRAPRPAPAVETMAESEEETPEAESAGREFVTHSLDRLEARLEALSRRLQQRGTGAPAAASIPAAGIPVSVASPASVAPLDPEEDDPEDTEDEDIAVQLAESRRLAEAEEEAEQARQAEIEAQREADAAAAEERRRQAMLAEARQHAQAIEARRQAEIAEAQRQSALAEARRAAAAVEARYQAELAEARMEAEAADRERKAELAEARRQAELVEARRQAELTEARREAEEADARRRAELEEARLAAEEADARRRAELEEARLAAAETEERRRAEAEAAAAALRQQAEEAAEERRRLAEEAAAERKRMAEMAEEAEAVRLADIAEARRQAEAAEERRREEMAEAKRQSEIAAARREAALAASLEQQFAAVESRIESLQQGLEENQVEPVRNELLELVKDMSDLSRSGRTASDALTAIDGRLDEMEMKLNAARNMAGNRLGDIQDHLTGLVERIEEIEVEIPGFDAVRENQSAILERFDRMEGLVHRLASAEELLERVDGLKRQLQTIASQKEVARVEERILKLADRLDALPADLSDEEAFTRIETQLGSLASDLTEARRQRKSVAAAVDEQLAEISAQLHEVAETGRTPDLSGIEGRIETLATSLAEDRRVVGEGLSRLEKRLGDLSEIIAAQEASAEVLADLQAKMDALGAAIEAQDADGARRDINGLDAKLDELARDLAAKAEHLSRQQIEPIGTRLDEMQVLVEQISKRTRDSNAAFIPLAQKLHQISEGIATLGEEGGPSVLSERLDAIEGRIAGLVGRSVDPRSLNAQLEAIGSRLEVLKGRSIDPGRLNELFDRIEVAIRAIPEDFGQRSEEGDIPPDRLDRLERKIAETAASGIAGERLSRLEKKLDDIGRAFAASGEFLTQDDLAELRSDIAALRRELRTGAGPGTGAGQPDEETTALMRTIAKRLERLPHDVPETIANLETQIARIAQVLDNPEGGSVALAGIHASLKTIEKRLDDTRRSLGYRPPRDLSGEVSDEERDAVAGLARSLSDDVASLRTSAEESEKKADDAIEAVQDTLEAVVKRMAFLERDADSAERPEPPAEDAEESAAKGEAEPVDEIDEPRPEPAAASEPAEAPSGGILSRFTSRQLLRRATGGRAESFSPVPEESEEPSDVPLEPGTDSPLASSLEGAPSSDTEFMSGGRRGRRPLAASALAARARSEDPSLVDDDFLAAARRAARAAEEGRDVADAGDADETEGSDTPRRFRGGAAVGVILLVAALAISAGLIIRNQIWPYEEVVALVNKVTQSTGPATTAALAPPSTAEDMSAAEEPAGASAMNDGQRPQESEAVATASVGGASKTEAAPPASDMSMAPARPQTASAAPASESIAEPPATSDMRAAAASPETAAPEANAPEMAASAPEAPDAAPTDLAPTEMAMGETAAPTDSTAGPAAMSATAGSDAQLASTEPASATPPASASAPSALSSGITDDSVTLPEAIGPPRLRAEALAGDPIASFEVAARYAEGRGVLADMHSAVAWYERSADAGLAPAQYRLGSIYEKGLGVPRDLTRAQGWYRKAADAGNVKAMHNLAVLYAEGAGGEPDLERAAVLFRQAAEHGVRDSQFNLAILHARGLGVQQDLVVAYKWFAVAATSGDEESAKRRDIIAQALSPQDLARAQAAAAAFQPLPLVSEANEMMMPTDGWRDGDSTSVEVKSDNDLVALVQKLLAENGYDPGPTDGLLGEKTIEAISQFQARSGLPNTGQIDTELVAALQKRST